MTRPMNEHSRQLVQKLWNYCNLLRDDGLSYGDYVEQLTYLLFLKMAHERTEPPRMEPSRLPEGYDWPSLVTKSGPELERSLRRHCCSASAPSPDCSASSSARRRTASRTPRSCAGSSSTSSTRRPGRAWTPTSRATPTRACWRRTRPTRSPAPASTSRRAPITWAMTEVMAPQPGQTIGDPACGTGGFLLSAFDYITKHNRLDREQLRFLRDHAFRGNEIVDNTARLCAMNLFLHGIGGADLNATPPIEVARRAAAGAVREGRPGAGQPAVRQDELGHGHRRGRARLRRAPRASPATTSGRRPPTSSSTSSSTSARC